MPAAVATITAGVSGAAGGTTQNVDYIADVAPAVAAHGQRWWHSTYARMFMYYVDVDSAQWIEI
jgi:hypothetical protein